ncbi:MAG: hypothetical protein WDW38_008764 [Sanguina aurantia]
MPGRQETTHTEPDTGKALSEHNLSRKKAAALPRPVETTSLQHAAHKTANATLQGVTNAEAAAALAPHLNPNPKKLLAPSSGHPLSGVCTPPTPIMHETGSETALIDEKGFPNKQLLVKVETAASRPPPGTGSHSMPHNSPPTPDSYQRKLPSDTSHKSGGNSSAGGATLPEIGDSSCTPLGTMRRSACTAMVLITERLKSDTAASLAILATLRDWPDQELCKFVDLYENLARAYAAGDEAALRFYVRMHFKLDI